MRRIRGARLFMPIVLLVLLWPTAGWHSFLGSAQQPPEASVNPFQRAVEEDLVKFTRSLATGDKAAILARYAPVQATVLFYPGPAPEQFQVQGWESINRFWEDYFKKFSNVQLRFSAEPRVSLVDGVAVATNTFSYESTQVSDSRKLYGYGRITVVYRNVDGHPLVVHEHLSYMASATPTP